MMDQELHTFFKSLNSVSRIATPKHAEKLRRGLLTQIQQQSVSNKFGKYELSLSYFFPFFMKYKNLLGAVSLTAAVFIGIMFFSFTTPTALAEKVINESLGKLADFTPIEIKNIFEKIGEDPINSLKEAKSAKDLKIITKDEFIDEFIGSTDTVSMIQDPNQPNVVGYTSTVSYQEDVMPEDMQVAPEGIGTIEVSTQDNKNGAIKVISSQDDTVLERGTIGINISTYLAYTDSLGRRVCLGLDANNIPVFKQVIFK